MLEWKAPAPTNGKDDHAYVSEMPEEIDGGTLASSLSEVLRPGNQDHHVCCLPGP
jgi:hypothetical protein